MKYRKTLCILIVGLLACYSACKEKPEKQETKTPPAIHEANYCFRKVYVHPTATSREDVLRMSLTVIGDSVVGSYNWLPFEKDARRGILRGTKKDSAMILTYFFMQEGSYDTAELNVVLKDGKAIVEGGDPSLGLSAVLTQLSCLE